MGGVVDTIVDIVESVVEIIVDVVETVVEFVGDIVGFVFSPFGAFDVPTGPQNPEQEARGVTITKSGTNVSIPVVYGLRRVGGTVIYIETNGEINKYLYAVYAVSEGEIQGFKKILVEDVPLPTPSGNTYNPGEVYTVTEGRFKDRIKFQVFNGTETQGQSSLANEAANWGKKQRKLPGVAYAVMRFEWKEIKTQEDANNNPFGGGIPKVQFDVYGKKVYDVRTHGSGKDIGATYGNLTKAYSFNPANCLLDYLMNPRYGCGLQSEEIDAEAFKIAANKYEQTVTYYTGATGRAHTMNAVIDTSQKLFDNVRGLVGGCRGILPYVQGRYKLKVEDGGNDTDITSTTIDVAFDVTKDYVIGGITLDGERKTSKFNEVIVNYVDPDLDFSNQQVYYSVNGDQAADDDELLRKEFNFPTLTNRVIASELARLIYKKSRAQRSISFNATQELIAVEVGDIIRVTDSVLNLNEDTFRVVDMKLNLDLSIAITAVEHDATVYPFTTGEQVELPPPLFLPDELLVRPRQKPIPVIPVGILPPLDPDAGDSAGEPQPPADFPPEPPYVEPVLTEIAKWEEAPTADELATRWGNNQDVFVTTTPTTDGTTVYKTSRGVSGAAKFFKTTTTKGLALPAEEIYPATHETYGYLTEILNSLGNRTRINLNSMSSVAQGDYILSRSSAYDWMNYGYTEITWLFNTPNPSTVNYAKIEAYDNSGKLIQTLDGRPIPSRYWQGYTIHGVGAFLTLRSDISFYKFRYLQNVGGDNEREIQDQSDLGQDYTYYDAIDKKTKTGRNIEAWLNYVGQNVELAVYGYAGGSLANVANVNKSTSHNLGV